MYYPYQYALKMDDGKWYMMGGSFFLDDLRYKLDNQDRDYRIYFHYEMFEEVVKDGTSVP